MRDDDGVARAATRTRRRATSIASRREDVDSSNAIRTPSMAIAARRTAFAGIERERCVAGRGEDARGTTRDGARGAHGARERGHHG